MVNSERIIDNMQYDIKQMRENNLEMLECKDGPLHLYQELAKALNACKTVQKHIAILRSEVS